MRAPSNKTRNKTKSSSSQKYSATNYRILEKIERLLRYAALYMEIKGDEIDTPQKMIEHASTKYIEYLKKQGVVFPDYLTDESSSPTPENPS